MRPEEWEAILMFPDLSHGNLPAQDRVTLGAVRSVFAPMNVRMAIRTIFAYVGENRLAMTLDTFHVFVQAPQGISGFAMIEFGDGADRLPSGGGVAVFAGDSQRAVGALSITFLASKRGDEQNQPENEHKPSANLGTLLRGSPF